MKTLWLTSLSSSEDPPKQFAGQMRKYGFDVKGHFWRDDLQKAAWVGAREELIDSNTLLWAIIANHEELLAPDTLYGLSLLTISVQAQRGLHFPIVILATQDDLIPSDQLSTPLKGSDVIRFSDAGLGAKIVAKAHTPPKALTSEYALDVIANEQIGQWFEVRPTQSTWPGVMFGVAGAKILFHAVGPKCQLPSKTVLNYPMEGLKLEMGEKEYVAWATQNELNAETSYYVKVEGFPESILFGPYSTEESADVFTLKLK
jgi:hypothetical protein